MIKDKKAKAAAKKLGLSTIDLKKLQAAALAVWSGVESEALKEGMKIGAEDAIEIVLSCDFTLYCNKLLTPRVREVLDTSADYELLQAAIRPVFKELYA